MVALKTMATVLLGKDERHEGRKVMQKHESDGIGRPGRPVGRGCTNFQIQH